MAARSLWDEMFGGTFTPTGYDYGSQPQEQPPAPAFSPVTGAPTDGGGYFRPGSFLDRVMRKNAPYDEQGNFLLWPWLRDNVLPEVPDPFAGMNGAPSSTAAPAPAPSSAGLNYTPIPRASTPAPYTPYAGNYQIPGVLPPLAPPQQVASRPVAGMPAAAADTTGGTALPATAQPVQDQSGALQPRVAAAQAPAGPTNLFGAPQAPGAFDRFSAFLHNLGNTQAGGFGAIADALQGAVTGQRMDPQGMQLAVMNNTYNALRARGWQDDMAIAGATNPEILKGMMAPPTWGVIRDDAFGKKYGWIYPQGVMMGLNGRQAPGPGGAAGGGTAPFAGSGGDVGTGGAEVPAEALAKGVSYNDNLKGDAWLAQFSPEMQGFVKAWLTGEQMPSSRGGDTQKLSGFAKILAQRYAMETTGVPLSDADFTEKRRLRQEWGSSGGGTLGGIVQNGVSAMGHLADASDSLVNLHNYSGPDVPGGAWLGEAGNIAKNVLGRTPAQDFALKKAKGWLLKYGQEGTKFYAGTGGGEGERTAALHENNPDRATASGLAGFLEQERDAMIERFRAAELRMQRDVPDFARTHPIFNNDLQQKIARINQNISLLRGGRGPMPTAATPPNMAEDNVPAPPPGFTRVQ